MQIFDPIARGDPVYTADGCQMMSYFHVEEDLNRNGHVKSILEQKTSLTAASPKMEQFKFNLYDRLW